MLSSPQTGIAKEVGGECTFLVDAVPQTSFIILGRSLSVPRPIRAHTTVQKLLHGAVVKRKVLKGVQLSNTAVLQEQQLLWSGWNAGLCQSPASKVCWAAGRYRAGERQGLCWECCVCLSLLLRPGPSHDADSPLLLGRVRLIFLSLCCHFLMTPGLLFGFNSLQCIQQTDSGKGEFCRVH